MIHYNLGIYYDEPNTKSYRGVFIDKNEKCKYERLVIVNTGNPKSDEELAIDKLFDIIKEEEIDLYYMSSYDHYFMDYDYENDPEYRAEVDSILKELEEQENIK